MTLRTFAAPVTSLLLALSVHTPAQAAGPVLHNTGTGLVSNDVDPHYTIVGSPVFGPNAYVKTEADGPPISAGGWLLDSPASAWLAPSTRFDFGDIPGITDDITYQTSFDLSGFQTSGGSITGRWAADDTGLEIRLNGVAVPGLALARYDDWTPFTITSGFVDGLNTLSFSTRSTLNPTGLRVEFTASEFIPAVPEPGSWALMFSGLLAVGGLARRRTHAQA